MKQSIGEPTAEVEPRAEAVDSSGTAAGPSGGAPPASTEAGPSTLAPGKAAAPTSASPHGAAATAPRGAQSPSTMHGFSTHAEVETALTNIISYCQSPITGKLFEDPVVCADGFTYERQWIKRWFAEGHRQSPTTNERLKHINLTPNLAIRSTLQELKNQHTLRLPEATAAQSMMGTEGGRGAYRAAHGTKTVFKVRMPESMPPLSALQDKFGVSGQDWLVVGVDRDPEEKLRWPDDTQVMIRCAEDRQGLLDSCKHGPRSHRELGKELKFASGLKVPAGYGVSLVEIESVQVGEMITLRQDRFNWLPGASTVLKKGHEVWVLIREYGQMEVEVSSIEDCETIQGLLERRGDKCMLSQDIPKFNLFKDYELLGTMGSEGKGEVPGDLVSWWNGGGPKRLTFGYSPREKIQRMLEAGGPAKWTESVIDVDHFTFRNDLFTDGARMLGETSEASASNPLNLRTVYGVNLIGVVHQDEEVWAPPPQQLVERGGKGLMLHLSTGVLLQDEDLKPIAELL